MHIDPSENPQFNVNGPAADPPTDRRDARRDLGAGALGAEGDARVPGGAAGLESFHLEVEWTAERELLELAELEPALADALARLGDRSVPGGLVDRVFASSVAMLPLPSTYRLTPGAAATDDRFDAIRLFRRWAPRIAMAASIGLALVIATPFAGVLSPSGSDGTGSTMFMPTLLADARSDAEPMLVALLCDGGGSACFLGLGQDQSANDFLVVDDAEVESLLRTRGARFDDFEAELGRILRAAPRVPATAEMRR